MKLFCTPYAGGTAEVFHKLGKLLKTDTDLVCIEYAGHGARAKEPFYDTFDAMVQDTAKEINARLAVDEPFALFGYSMGSVVCYECMAQGLLKGNASHFFIASHEAPGEHWASMDYAGLDDLAFFRKLVDFGGFKAEDEARLDNRFFRRLIFNPIKADYDLIAQYELKDDVRLCVPATMLYSPNDVPPKAARCWQKRFERPMEFIEIGSNHFFIKEEVETLAQVINDRI